MMRPAALSSGPGAAMPIEAGSPATSVKDLPSAINRSKTTAGPSPTRLSVSARLSNCSSIIIEGGAAACAAEIDGQARAHSWLTNSSKSRSGAGFAALGRPPSCTETAPFRSTTMPCRRPSLNARQAARLISRARRRSLCEASAPRWACPRCRIANADAGPLWYLNSAADQSPDRLQTRRPEHDPPARRSASDARPANPTPAGNSGSNARWAPPA